MHSLLLSLLLATSDFVCGTSPETDRRAREVHRLASARQPAAPPQARVADDVVFLKTDATMTPNDDPLDLEGTTLHFTRRGAATFSVERLPLAYDAEVGPLFVRFDRTTSVKKLPLRFAFPFGGKSYPEVTLSRMRGIHFTADPALPAQTLELLAAVTDPVPLISPHLDYANAPSSRPDVFVKESDAAVTITWRSQVPGGTTDYDLQSVLYANGDVRLSYKLAKNFAWGGVIVHPGDAWLAQRALLGGGDDPAGDVDASYGEARGMLDLERAELARVAGTSLLALRIRLAAPIDRKKLPAGTAYRVFIGDSFHTLELTVYADRTTYFIPGRSEVVDSPAARIEGDEIVLYAPEERLALPRRDVPVYVYANSGGMADWLEMRAELGAPGIPLETDFSAASGEASRPLVETYSLPTLNVHGVWSALERLGYRGEEIDAVAIYPGFLTDIILSRFGAYATGGNNGVDGVSHFQRKSAPRTPSLMHMNSLFAFAGEERVKILMHELGHRWLYYFELKEGETAGRLLNPAGPHPAQWVHTPAAFNVKSSADVSAMGGAVFTAAGGGTYTTPPAVSQFGFSWHELYLMGLARPEEVPPWFYLRDTTLGGEYHAPANTTVAGERVDVSLQQLIAAMGPRDPAFDDAQKTFRVMFVVLERDAALTFDGALRKELEEAFATATGGRGKLVTSLPAARPERRRAVGK